MALCTVYHTLGKDDDRNLISLRESGLFPLFVNLQRGKVHDRISLEESIDSKADEFLPQALRDKGFRRLKSVFATLHIPQTRERTVELIVDGEQGLVLPMDYYTSVRCSGNVADRYIRLYWSQALLLEEFLAQYEFNPDSAYGLYDLWQNRNGFVYFEPEVIFIPKAIKEFRRILLPSPN